MRKQAQLRRNFWPFSDAKKHGTIPAHGGIAAHSKKRRALSLASYKGYRISRTPGGEYYSSLDPQSWYESVGEVKKAITSHLKGRENPKKNALPLAALTPLDIWDVEQLDSLGKGIFTGLKSGGKGRKSKGKKRARSSVPGRDPRRRNPKNPVEDATRMYEDFHGKPSEKITDIEEAIHYHAALAELGLLKELRIKTRNAGMISLKNFDGTLLCSNEQGTQLYFLGGDQTVDLMVFDVAQPYHDFEDLGEVKQIRYFTTKEHLGTEGGRATYYHDFGEEDVEHGERARRPRLVYSVRDKRLALNGGAYQVKPEGIAN